MDEKKIDDKLENKINELVNEFGPNNNPQTQKLAELAKQAREKRAEATTLIADPTQNTALDLLTLDEALTRLAELDPRQAKLVEYRFFGGMTIEEIAAVLGVSKSTVDKEWRRVRAWLRAELQGRATSP